MEGYRRLEGLTRRLGRVERELNDLRSTVLERLTPGEWQTPTLLNSWTNTGGVNQNCRYRLEPAGRVVIEGSISPGTQTNGTDLFVLAAGYRPAAQLLFTVNTASAVTPLRVLIQADGTVELGNTHTGTYLSFAGVTFAVA